MLEERPEPQPQTVTEPEVAYRSPIKRNYIQIEQENISIGKRGEQIALDFEKWRLIKEGNDKFVDKIEWVSDTQGDGLGFDILSRNANGTDRYIEVKTTKLTKEAPIFFSSNEYEFSTRNQANYYLYRVFNLKSAPKIFIANGKFDSFCKVKAVGYKGTF